MQENNSHSGANFKSHFIKTVWFIPTDRSGCHSLYVLSGITSKCLKLIQLSYRGVFLNLQCPVSFTLFCVLPACRLNINLFFCLFVFFSRPRELNA